MSEKNIYFFIFFTLSCENNYGITLRHNEIAAKICHVVKHPVHATVNKQLSRY